MSKKLFPSMNTLKSLIWYSVFKYFEKDILSSSFSNDKTNKINLNCWF